MDHFEATWQRCLSLSSSLQERAGKWNWENLAPEVVWYSEMPILQPPEGKERGKRDGWRGGEEGRGGEEKEIGNNRWRRIAHSWHSWREERNWRKRFYAFPFERYSRKRNCVGRVFFLNLHRNNWRKQPVASRNENILLLFVEKLCINIYQTLCFQGWRPGRGRASIKDPTGLLVIFPVRNLWH